MKRLFANRNAAFVLLAITLVVLALYGYILARPISYGMEYEVDATVAGYEFKSSVVFHRNDKITISNSNFDEPISNYYYYKDGYVFICVADTEEDFAAEVEAIEADFEAALDIPFYASTVNAFSFKNESPDDTVAVTQVCNSAVTMAFVGGLVLLSLVSLTVAAFICKPAKKNTVTK